jgi:uncharacterized membrane protein YphA (DoxX/SURF4 family)
VGKQGRLGLGVIRRVETLRLLFGGVWAIDAYLKWQPGFVHGYAGDVASAAQGQPGWLRPWFRFWRHLVSHDPRLLAYATAVIETVIAFALLLGFARRAVYLGGALWSLGVWIIPEGFGSSFLAGDRHRHRGHVCARVRDALQPRNAARSHRRLDTRPAHRAKDPLVAHDR